MRKLDLSGSLSIRDSGDLVARLAKAIEGSKTVLVDATKLTGVDTSILQILVAAHKTARKRKKSLKIKTPAKGALEAALQRSGIAGAANGRLLWDGDFWIGLNDDKAGIAA